MKKLFTILMTLSLGLAGFSQIVITEISYNGPESGTDSTEFIEFYNKTSSSINLTGYTISSGVNYTFPNVSIAANGYLVVSVDSVAIKTVYGASAYQWTGGLSNGGESIALKNSSGKTIDSLRYDDNSPWPGGGTSAGSPDGGGASLVFCDTSKDNAAGANWKASTHTVTGKIINGKQVYGSPGKADSVCFTTPPPPKAVKYYPIATVATDNSTGIPDSLNLKCILGGVVHGINMGGSSTVQFILYDATGAITVRKSGGFTPSYTVKEGDSIAVVGTVSQYNGLTQFNADTILVKVAGGRVRMPMKTAKPNASTESHLIRVDSVEIISGSWPSSGSSANLTVVSAKNDTLTVRIDRNGQVDDSVSAPFGKFDVIVYGGQYDSKSPYTSGYQIFPQVKGHIIKHPATPPPPKAIPHYGLGIVTTEDASLRTDSANVACSVSGVVHGIDMSGLGSSSNTFQLFDATGHITVYKSRGFTPSYTVNESDSVTLYGKVTQYNGLTQFSPDSIKVHGNGAGLKSWRNVTKLDESTESDYIRIDSVRLLNASQWPTIGNQNNVDILTQAGDTLTLRIDRDSYVDDSVAAPAGLFDVIGYGGQFDPNYTSGYNILPQLKNHIIMYAAAACNAPDSLDVQNVTDVSADLKWKTGGSNTWNVEYGVKGFTQGSGTMKTSFANPYLVSGLTANTDYDFYVQDSCFGLGVSAWSSVKGFKTAAGPKPIPFYKIKDIRGIDTLGNPDSIDVECWISGVVFTSDFDGNNGYTFGVMDDTRGITIHSFNDVNNYVVKDGDSLKLKGTVKFYNGLNQFRVDSIVRLDSNKRYKMPAVVTKFDETTESEFIEVRNVYLADTSQWPTAGNNANVDIVTPAGDTLMMRIDRDTDVDDMWPIEPDTFTVRGIGAQYDGSSPYLSGYQIFPRWFMDIDTTPKPPCMAPIALKSANVTVSSADISWTSGGGMWNVGWSLNHTSTAADIVDSVMGVTTNPYTVTGLNQNQQYHVYVQEVCRDEHSKWSDPVMFTTLATGINNLDGNKTSLVAFPNPNNIGEVRFNMEISVTVRNILGQTVKSAKEVTSLDISDLDSGVYLIQSEEGDTIRFIVE